MPRSIPGGPAIGLVPAGPRAPMILPAIGLVPAGPRSSMVRVALGPGVYAPWSSMIAARPMVYVAVISEPVLDAREAHLQGGGLPEA